MVSGKKITKKMEKTCHYLIVSKNKSLHGKHKTAISAINF